MAANEEMQCTIKEQSQQLTTQPSCLEMHSILSKKLVNTGPLNLGEGEGEDGSPPATQNKSYQSNRLL